MRLKLLTVLNVLLYFSNIISCQIDENFNFGGYSICQDLYAFILNSVKPNGVILELGSGAATQQLAQCYTMYSIEHDEKWLDKYNSHYIYAPIVKYDTYRWYDVNALEKSLPNQYDMILVDGPPGNIGRYGFLINIHLFNTDVLMIFDDVQRFAESKLLRNVAHLLNKSYVIYKCSDGKLFGVING